ncbi:hypothetical protein [Aeromonas sp. SG16]|uniref:hypothetical protein n=1 Tax=Aeromonas sp. SG16 TaxID=2950548 RepID=UPI00210B57CC|nr:hypothetical protein [Aeromonas sp. SG16]MCQ4054453.1 hypothetical protein [Aeromonas sp. SG16]
MDEWSFILLKNIENNWGLIGLAITAALAQTASSEKPSLYAFFISMPMCFFVVWMTWLAVAHLALGEQLQIFWSGVAAFSAPWILRGVNVILHQFIESPIDFLLKLKELLKKRL